MANEEAPGTALITGGTSGIGAAVAAKLAARGHDLLLTYRANSERADAFQAELHGAHGVQVETFAGDIVEADHVDRLLAHHAARFDGRPVQLLMHGAGRYLPEKEKFHLVGGVENFEVYDYYQSLYPKAFVRLVEAVVEAMPDERGRIVALSSPGVAANQRVAIGYDMPGQAKATMEMLARIYATRLAERRITVNLVTPGIVPTPGWLGYEPEQIEQFAQKIVPMKRSVSPQDIANTVGFLFSDQARSITGVNIQVDGGRHLT